MPSPTIQVLGLEELKRKMLTLGSKISRNALKSALVAGAKEVKKEALVLAPVKTGRMRKAIYIKKMGKPNPFKENVILGVRSGKKLQKRNLDAYYWKFIEFGHLTRPKGKARSRSGRASALAGGGKMVAAQPFVRPAFQNSKERALSRFKVVLADFISKISREK